MFSNNRTYFPEELSLNGHTLAVTNDFWKNNNISMCNKTINSDGYLQAYKYFYNTGIRKQMLKNGVLRK